MTITPMPPTISVRCETEGCPNTGFAVTVPLGAAAPGIYEWPALVCAGCSNEPKRVDHA